MGLTGFYLVSVGPMRAQFLSNWMNLKARRETRNSFTEKGNINVTGRRHRYNGRGCDCCCRGLMGWCHRRYTTSWRFRWAPSGQLTQQEARTHVQSTNGRPVGRSGWKCMNSIEKTGPRKTRARKQTKERRKPVKSRLKGVVCRFFLPTRPQFIHKWMPTLKRAILLKYHIGCAKEKTKFTRVKSKGPAIASGISPDCIQPCLRLAPRWNQGFSWPPTTKGTFWKKNKENDNNLMTLLLIDKRSFNRKDVYGIHHLRNKHQSNRNVVYFLWTPQNGSLISIWIFWFFPFLVRFVPLGLISFYSFFILLNFYWVLYRLLEKTEAYYFPVKPSSV